MLDKEKMAHNKIALRQIKNGIIDACHECIDTAKSQIPISGFVIAFKFHHGGEIMTKGVGDPCSINEIIKYINEDSVEDKIN